jgi:transposase
VWYRIKVKAVIFNKQSIKKQLAYSFCGSKSIWVYSTYRREIQDLPIQGKHVILFVTIWKMFCKNPDCQHKTFAESHLFAVPRAKKTDQLFKNIILILTQLSSLNVSRFSKSENITT